MEVALELEQQWQLKPRRLSVLDLVPTMHSKTLPLRRTLDHLGGFALIDLTLFPSMTLARPLCTFPVKLSSALCRGIVASALSGGGTFL